MRAVEAEGLREVLVHALDDDAEPPARHVPGRESCGRRRFTASMGMAKPMPLPCGLMAVLMPTTCPRRLKSGPPLLPGLMLASVWMKSS